MEIAELCFCIGRSSSGGRCDQVWGIAGSAGNFPWPCRQALYFFLSLTISSIYPRLSSNLNLISAFGEKPDELREVFLAGMVPSAFFLDLASQEVRT